jgi:hypothetical protein
MDFTAAGFNTGNAFFGLKGAQMPAMDIFDSTISS